MPHYFLSILQRVRMRTLLIVISVLSIAAVVYGFKIERLRKINDDFMKCREELGGSPNEPLFFFRIETIKCAAIKNDLLNEKGEYIYSVVMQTIEDCIADAGRLEQVKTIFKNCFDEAIKNGATGNEQTEKIIKCGILILGMVNKLQ